MNIRRIFITIVAVMLTSAVFADTSSVTSKKYVDDFMTGYQNKIPGSGTNKLMIYDSNESDGINQKAIVSELGSSTSAANVPNVGAVLNGLDGKQETFNGTAGYVMTGTDNTGYVGERAIYGTSSQYNSALVTAETINTAVTNAVNSSLIRVNEQGVQSDSGTLWEIVDDLTALNICSNYTNATGTVVQNGTPTPTNPIAPFFYQQGDMILRRVGNYADSYDANTNKITRRVGVKVLDGTESWLYYSVAQGDLFRLILSDSVNGLRHEVGVICNAYRTVSDRTNETLSGANQNYDFLNSNYTTLGAWKQYLVSEYAAGTPVVIYYPLATPVTEDMPPRCQ